MVSVATLSETVLRINDEVLLNNFTNRQLHLLRPHRHIWQCSDQVAGLGYGLAGFGNAGLHGDMGLTG